MPSASLARISRPQHPLRLLYLALALEAVACATVSLAPQRAASAAAASAWISAAVFPFRPLGSFLRALSLSGAAGNAVACVLYAAFCLIPIAPLALHFVKRSGKSGSTPDGAASADGSQGCARVSHGTQGLPDMLLAMLSLLLFFMMYGMVNPGVLRGWFPDGLAEMGTVCIALTFWSLVLAYVLLRGVARLRRCGVLGLQRALALSLAALDAFCVALAFGVLPARLAAELSSIRAASNALSAAQLRPTVIMLMFGLAVDALPWLLDVAVIHRAFALLQASRTARYATETVAAAQRLADLCSRTVTLTVLAQAACNVLQLLTARQLYSSTANIHFPLGPLVLTLALLVLARWLAEGHALQAENDGFV